MSRREILINALCCWYRNHANVLCLNRIHGVSLFDYYMKRQRIINALLED